MDRDFLNCYEDDRRAAAYATLGFEGTYYLAYRDLPQIFARHVRGNAALDFGCGAGRSTRFLLACGFDAIGIDISPQMIAKAKEIDPQGDYRLIADQFPQLDDVDLVLSAFTFDNIATREKKVSLFASFRSLLRGDGVIVNLVSSPEIYVHEWTSFSTKDFPENRTARSGDIVRVIMNDHPDSRPVEDIFWTEEAYRDVYASAGLQVESVYKPLAKGDEPFAWINETRIAPWTIYVLRK
jgi:SAM-dependent methyltransferase